MRMFLHRFGKVNAPEFPKGLSWLNSDPLTMKQLSGHPVLVDFWTYSCVNCARTTPHLNEWYKRYADQGLVIVGVHTPEFEFEKDEDNVAEAVKNFKIKYPVVLDPDYKVWHLYANRWWPRKFLVDAKGQIVYDHVGEGNYAQTEMAIQAALQDTGVKNLMPVKPDQSSGGGICYRTTPETYLGFMRGRFGNAAGLSSGVEGAYTDPGEHQEDIVYLHGHWTIDKEALVHARALPSPTEYLALKYNAFSVNLVMGSRRGPLTVILELDGKSIPKDMWGSDVTEAADGRSVVKVDEHRMYSLVNANIYHQGNLKIRTDSPDFEAFAFTFGGCAE